MDYARRPGSLANRSAVEINVKRILLGMLISALVILAAVALTLSALLYFTQDGMIFHPQPASVAELRATGLAIDKVRIDADDGTALYGWLARPEHRPAPLPLIIYFGGNAEEVSHLAAQAGRFGGWALLAVNYRGYGASLGKPSEAALCADAVASHDWAARHADIEASRIVAMGRSLGSGVAVFLASQRPLAGVVLVTPYDSLTGVAQHHYPYAPVSLLLRHTFDSARRAPHIFAPVLVLAARRDSIVPARHARALFDKWAGPKTWREFPDAGHNDLEADPEYWSEITTFLAQRS